MAQISAHIDQIRAAVHQAQGKSPFAAKDVLILAVTKNVDAGRINEALAAGITAIGENRVQEIMDKYDRVNRPVAWHLIGHLQSNKVKYIIEKVELIHSLDSISLAQEIDRRAEQAGRVMPVLVQVNVADEETKFGLAPAETVPFIEEVSSYGHIRVRGLMTIGPLVEDAEQVRPVFRRLRELRDEIGHLSLPGVEMSYLSMGMTNDYPIAVEEGANIIRIGSAIFGSRSI